MLIGAHFSLSDWTSLVSLALAAMAALFARRAVHYARHTVKDGETASEAAASRHTEEIAEMRSLLTATHNAHEEDASDPRRLYDHDLIIRRVAQIQRIREVLLDLIDAARTEWTNPTAALRRWERPQAARDGKHGAPGESEARGAGPVVARRPQDRRLGPAANS
jgi:hypothetical protein